MAKSFILMDSMAFEADSQGWLLWYDACLLRREGKQALDGSFIEEVPTAVAMGLVP